MTDLRRNALCRDVTSRLYGCSLDQLRILDKLLVRLEQLRNLSWTRRVATGPGDVDSVYHLPAVASGNRFATRCAGSWSADDAVEKSVDGPPLHEMCGACLERWARGKDLELYGLVDLARDLATEDLIRATLHEEARLEMTGGGT